MASVALAASTSIRPAALGQGLFAQKQLRKTQIHRRSRSPAIASLAASSNGAHALTSLADRTGEAVSLTYDNAQNLLSSSEFLGIGNSIAVLGELTPENAALIATLLGPTLAVVNLLFIFRIVMSWYPQLPVKDLPFSIAYIPTEPLLSITRRAVPPVGGVDVAPVIWLAFFSFINEILLGQQGLLVLISQQQI